MSWLQLQQSILSKVRCVMKSEAPIQVSVHWGGDREGGRDLGGARRRWAFAVTEAFTLPDKTALILDKEATIPWPVPFYSSHLRDAFHGQGPFPVKSLKTPLG